MFELNDQELEQVAGGSHSYGSSAGGDASGSAYSGSVYTSSNSSTKATKHSTSAENCSTAVACGYYVGADSNSCAGSSSVNCN